MGNLSSLGDVLMTVNGLSHVKAQKAEGVGAGASKIPSIFTAREIPVDNSVTKINGLVNEYTGVLHVDKVANHAGNFVFINGRAVGLSNKLNDFESLAVRMGHYEATLAKLTASLAGKKK